MNITAIHPEWGSTIEFESPLDFFKQDKGYWRDLIYKRKLLIFKKMNFSNVDYAKFGYHFGSPWNVVDYSYSYESPMKIKDGDTTYVFTRFSSNVASKQKQRSIGASEMPWHADIPNRRKKPFPFRSLWMERNPNTEFSGKTQWLEIEHGINFLSDRLKQLIPRVKVLQQSWYTGTGDLQMHDFIKVNPITGNKSLRLNYYVGYPGVKSNNAWIKKVYIDGVEQPDCSLIQEYIDELLQFPELMYKHTWDERDIAIYDNYPFIHGRSSIELPDDHLPENSDRVMYRMNIDHLTEDEWSTHTFM